VGRTRALELTLSSEAPRPGRLMLRRKHERRLDDESVKPLATYRAEELARMRVNFFGPDPAYHEARRHFVFKGNPPPQRNQVPIEAEAEEASWVLPHGAARPTPLDAGWVALSPISAAVASPP